MVLSRKKTIGNATKVLSKKIDQKNFSYFATSSINVAQKFSLNILISIAVKHMKKYCQHLKKEGLNPSQIILASKGFDKETKQTSSQIVQEIWPLACVLVLSGGSHAHLLIKKDHTRVMIASSCSKLVLLTKKIFACSYLKLYKTNDLRGIELYGAVKNVYAIGAGIIEALGFKENTKAAYATQAIKELRWLGKSFKVDKETIFSFAGIGDLLATIYSKKSRNYCYGKWLVTQNSLDKPTTTTEGINTIKSCIYFQKIKKLKLPIIQAINFAINNPLQISKKIIINLLGDRDE